MAHNRKVKRELSVIAEKYGLKFHSTTPTGHYRWVHEPTGRTVISVSCIGNWRELKNTENRFRRKLMQIEQEGSNAGSGNSD